MNNAKSPNSEFVGKRLENMRWKRGLTKKGLAEIADIDQHLISAFESGGKAPNREQAHRLAEALHAKESYFYLEWQSDLTQEDLSFRAPTKTTVRNKNAAIAIAAQGVELRSWIEKHYSLPKEDLPDYSFCVNGGDGPEAAAEFLRAHWNLGNQPIGNRFNCSSCMASLFSPPGKRMRICVSMHFPFHRRAAICFPQHIENSRA